MSDKPYGLFCPIAKACEVLEPRWTMPILAEMSCGTTRFNELRRGMPRISPTLLSKRLKEMEEQGLVERIIDKGSGTVDYVRTPRALELHPILVALGHWAQRNIDAEAALCDRDALNTDVVAAPQGRYGRTAGNTHCYSFSTLQTRPRKKAATGSSPNPVWRSTCVCPTQVLMWISISTLRYPS